MKHVVLYFGSFNPVHRGHIALAEWVAEHVGCDEVVLVVSPKNPLKADDSLAPELNRFEMAELACARSRFPERIKPSVIEFLLEKPSYTIDTLRYLSRNYGGQMRFSVLLGADLVPQLERWRDYREILDGYPLLVYPRRGFETTQYLDRITLLNEAPLCDFSSTEVRRALEQGDDASAMLTPEVLAYIREKRALGPRPLRRTAHRTHRRGAVQRRAARRTRTVVLPPPGVGQGAQRFQPARSGSIPHATKRANTPNRSRKSSLSVTKTSTTRNLRYEQIEDSVSGRR